MILYKDKIGWDLEEHDIDASYYLKKILQLNVDKSNCIYDDGLEDAEAFYKYKDYSLDEIISLVKLNKHQINHKIYHPLINKTILQQYLNVLIMQGQVVLTDNLNDDNKYRYVNKNLQRSNYTREYAKIKADKPDKILLISDTHIGSEFEDFELIKRAFGYAIKNHDIKSAIHLGDVFEGIRLDKGKYNGYTLDDPIILDILYNQINSFEKNFPDFLKVLAIEGNHDLNIINLLKKYCNINEHYLSILKPNFHLLKKREFGHEIDLEDFRIHLNHELQYNMFFTYVKTYEVDNIEDYLLPFTKFNTNNIDLYLSGHFHYDMNYYINDDNNITKRRYEVIPSLSKMKEDCLAKILKFIYDDNGNTLGYTIIPLYTIDGKNIFEGNKRNYESNQNIKRKCR